MTPLAQRQPPPSSAPLGARPERAAVARAAVARTAVARTAVACALSAAATACGAAPPQAGPPVAPPITEHDAPPASRAEDSFIELYARTAGFRHGRPTAIRVTPRGDAVLFLRSGPQTAGLQGAGPQGAGPQGAGPQGAGPQGAGRHGAGRDLYTFDPETGEERVLVTADQLLQGAQEELSAEERARRERLRLSARGIAGYELSRDGSLVLVPLSGRLFVLDRASGRTREIGRAEGYPNEARFSPDGTKVACVRNGDLHVIDVAANTERRLTSTAGAAITNGIPEFVAQEEMGRFQGYWFSPDGAKILYQETDTSGVETLRIVDPMHPEGEVHEAPYPRPGRANARVRLGVVRASGGPTRWLEWDREAFPYLTQVAWSQGAPLTVLVQDRLQRTLRILAADPETGRTRTLHTEEDAAWLNLDPDMPRWIDEGRAFLWTTERGGAWQLEVRDREGRHVRTLTEPSLGYEGLVHVDAAAGAAIVRASAEPTQMHLWRVRLDGSAPPEALTTEPGLHAGYAGGDVLVRESQPREGGMVWSVSRGGQAAGTLRSAAEALPFTPNVEWLTVGERGLHAAVVRPRHFDPALRYPVLVSVYGGPHARTVQASPLRYLMQQWYADHGFVVVSIDGRGTPGRGRAWERAIAGNFIRLPLEDQATGLQALLARFPELDPARVGIYGWSFGGYFSAMAVMRRPDLWHAGIAGAPVADWRDYDTHYTERYIGLPDENAAGYDDGSVLTHAPALERPLLIVHGTVDDNVYFTHAIKLSDALLRAGREHAFLPLSGFTHMVAEPAVTLSLHRRMIGFFERHLRAPAPPPAAAAP